jgi:antitoxin ParD1/3/4
MTTMNISLPDVLKSFVDEQVARRRYGSTSEYMRDLIRRDLERTGLRDLLLAGAASEPAAEVDDEFLNRLRVRARQTPGG